MTLVNGLFASPRFLPLARSSEPISASLPPASGAALREPAWRSRLARWVVKRGLPEPNLPGDLPLGGQTTPPLAVAKNGRSDHARIRSNSLTSASFDHHAGEVAAGRPIGSPIRRAVLVSFDDRRGMGEAEKDGRAC